MLKFFRIPFATSGDKTAVPDAVDVNGFVSYTSGYGFDYQRQKTDPAAKNIERDKMNEIFFDITTAISEIQAQGVPDYITSALNGGTAYSYAANALVRYSGEIYQSLVGSNTALPTDATKWALIPTGSRIQSATYTSAVSAGTADAITAAFTPAIAALPAAPGTLVVRTRAGFANATATPTFSPNGLTAKTIVKGNNLPLVAGDIPGAGAWIELVYDATLDRWVLQNPATGVTSGTQFASNAEAQAYASTTKAISPATLAAALQGANQSLASSGYQKLPGGLILQWGTTGSIATNSSAGVTFPVAFTTAFYAGLACQIEALASNEPVGVSCTSGSTTGMTVYHYSGTAQARSFQWFAIGK